MNTQSQSQSQSQFDLNLANYSLRDVESFFQFVPGSSYTPAQVDLREAEIRQLLLSSGHIHKRFQRDLIQFLNEAKQSLIRHAQDKANAATATTTTTQYPGTEITTLTHMPQMDPFPNLPYDPAAAAMRERGDNLLRHQAMPYMGTMPSDVFASDNGLNPLKVRTLTRCVNIDTRFRHMPTMTETADLTIHLPFKLEKVVSMQLASIEFPLVLPGISQAYGNHYFWIATAPDTAHQYEIRIPDGDYGAQELLDVIHQEVAATAAAQSDPTLASIEFVLDPKTGRVMVHSLTGAGFALDFVRRSGDVLVGHSFGTDGMGGGGMVSNTMEEMVSTRVGYNLGMMRGLYGDMGDVGTYRGEWMGETRMDPTCPLRYVYVAVEDFQQNVNNHFVSAFETSVLAPDIFVRLSVKGSTQTTWSEGGMRQLCETNHGMISEPRRYFGPVSITRLRVRVLDDHGRLLRLGMTNYSMSLVFKMIYDL